ncbi:MAG TPA: dihydroorotase [Methanocorpusculum sp.]|nr:dihydroorotase [Methanocorpusculum sp.]
MKSARILSGTDAYLAHQIPDAFSAVFDSDVFSFFPGFCDVHVHFREPGFSHKETIMTGSRAAAHGGYTAVCTMPNLHPVPDSLEHLKVQQDIIDADAVIPVYPYGAITCGEQGQLLADMSALAPRVIAFSDDGHGVQSEDMMRKAMCAAKQLGKIIAAHCEVDALVHGGYIHDGTYARQHQHKGISSESEYAEVERDIRLAEETGCAFHICHISTKESVDAVRRAKQRGVDVTCETAPHYLVMDDSCLQEDGRFKMNPPLRDAVDREALIRGIQDGTVDMIATDHAPHTQSEKANGLEKSPFGITGLETAFPVLYTCLVRAGTISLEKLIDLLAVNPRKRFSIPFNGYSVWNLNEMTKIDSSEFLSMGKSTPFEGMDVYGCNYLTVASATVAYRRNTI